MRLARALALTHDIVSTHDSLDSLGSLLDPALVEQALEKAGVATVRKRRLPLEMMLWCVIGMAFFRRMSAWDVVSRMNIMLPGQRPLVAPSAVVQGCQRLGSDAVPHVFDLTQKMTKSASAYWSVSSIARRRLWLKPQHFWCCEKSWMPTGATTARTSDFAARLTH